VRGFTLMELIIFIVLAALVIPAFFISASPVVRDAVIPTAMIKARFLGESKMEEIMAYTIDALPAQQAGWVNVDTTNFPGYTWKWTYQDVTCNNSSPANPANPCFGYTGTSIVDAAGTTNYRKISVFVALPFGGQYEAHSMVTRR
jgi:type II secretory pathway pseudopilin PulG